jgi:hypothetical protein
MLQIKIVEKIKTHILCSTIFSQIPAVYEIMSKNLMEPERHKTIWHIHIACWISKATHTQVHTQRNALIITALPRQLFGECFTMVCYTYVVPHFNFMTGSLHLSCRTQNVHRKLQSYLTNYQVCK